MVLLKRIVEWAGKDSSIKALILQGSRAVGIADPYSDYDLAIVCTSIDAYTEDEKWLSTIGEVWVCVEEKITCKDKVFPTKLVIFEGGIKVDFAFYTMDVLQDLLQEPSSVLVDKESLIESLPKVISYPAVKPTKQEFERVLKEFWFEVYHVMKYLKRDDLWSVKFRSGLIYDQFLLKMIEWNEEARRDWQSPVPLLGKRMRSWVDPEIEKALHQVFAHFDRQDSEKSLLHAIELFRKLAIDTAKRLGYTYLDDLDQHISGLK